jgi:sulfide:quinone oxidoreductase
MDNKSRIVVLGDGMSGLTVANKLRLRTSSANTEIVVIGISPRHFFKPDGLLIPFNMKEYSKSLKSARFLLHNSIVYLHDEAVKINIEQRSILLRSGKTEVYDYLIISTGAAYSPEILPGYEGEGKHFEDLQHALELKNILERFNGGNIVVASPEGENQCPPYTFQFAILLDEYLKKKGIRDKSKISLLIPFNTILPPADEYKIAEDIVSQHGVELQTNFQVNSISEKNHEVVSKSGEHANYSLLVMVPPHRGQHFLVDSGISLDTGYVDVDKVFLNYKDRKEVFAIGDATNLNVPRTELTCVKQADVVSSIIAKDIGSDYPLSRFKGEASCLSFAGDKKAFSIYEDYDNRLRVGRINKFDFLIKLMEADTYFSYLVRGM